jgi:hypothetical protein
MNVDEKAILAGLDEWSKKRLTEIEKEKQDILAGSYKDNFHSDNFKDRITYTPLDMQMIQDAMDNTLIEGGSRIVSMFYGLVALVYVAYISLKSKIFS